MSEKGQHLLHTVDEMPEHMRELIFRALTSGLFVFHLFTKKPRVIWNTSLPNGDINFAPFLWLGDISYFHCLSSHYNRYILFYKVLSNNTDSLVMDIIVLMTFVVFNYFYLFDHI